MNNKFNVISINDVVGYLIVLVSVFGYYNLRSHLILYFPIVVVLSLLYFKMLFNDYNFYKSVGRATNSLVWSLFCIAFLSMILKCDAKEIWAKKWLYVIAFIAISIVICEILKIKKLNLIKDRTLLNSNIIFGFMICTPYLLITVKNFEVTAIFSAFSVFMFRHLGQNLLPEIKRIIEKQENNDHVSYEQSQFSKELFKIINFVNANVAFVYSLTSFLIDHYYFKIIDPEIIALLITIGLVTYILEKIIEVILIYLFRFNPVVLDKLVKRKDNY